MSDLRKATANRLSGCDCAPPPPMPMPDHIMPLSVFEDLLYKVAYQSGYIGSKTDFRQDLADSLNGASQINGLVVQKGSVDDFPTVGIPSAIYIDTERNDIYYWKEDEGYYKINSGGGGVDLNFSTLDGGDAFTRF